MIMAQNHESCFFYISKFPIQNSVTTERDKNRIRFNTGTKKVYIKLDCSEHLPERTPT